MSQCYFAASVHHRNFDLVSFSDELSDVTHLGLQIMLAGLGPYLYLFELKGRLSFFGLLSLFGQFIFISTIVHYFANRRICIGRDFHEIKAEILGGRQGLVCRDNADLVAVGIYDSYLFGSDISIDICSI